MTEGFAYDKVGNLIQNTRNGATEAWTYDAANQLLQAGSTRYSYDAKGQLIRRESTDGQSNLGWNPEGTLRTLETRNPMTGEVLVRADYRYNGRGLRTEKVVNAQTTRYTLDGPEVLFESDGSAQVKNAYLHSLTLDEVLLRKDFATPDNTGFLHADALGSVRMTTDMTGTIRSRTSYFVYGETRTESGPLPAFRFTSRELDPETSLYYSRARYLDPRVGRFLSQDPIESKLIDPLSFNQYLYVFNNPVTWTDPSGLERSPAMQGNNPWEPTPERVLRWTGRVLQQAGRRTAGRALSIAGLVLEPSGTEVVLGILIGSTIGAAVGSTLGTWVYPGPGTFIGGVGGAIFLGSYFGEVARSFSSPHAGNAY